MGGRGGRGAAEHRGRAGSDRSSGGRTGRVAALVAAVRAVHGLLLLTAPGAVARLLVGPAAQRHDDGRRPAAVPPLDAGSADRVLRRVCRVLGARQLLQSAAGVALRRRRVALGGVGVDLLHALSMVAAARLFPRYRTAATVDAAIATGFACAGTLAAGVVTTAPGKERV